MLISVNPGLNPGRCALHWAVEYNNPDLLEIMLRAGASKTILDEELKEPLDIAVELSTIKCISAILRSCSKEVYIIYMCVKCLRP